MLGPILLEEDVVDFVCCGVVTFVVGELVVVNVLVGAIVVSLVSADVLCLVR